MYGFGLDTRATQYQASIADQPSKFALAVLERERDRTNEIRIWHHKCLESLPGPITRRRASVPWKA
jgi:hypothetical protein